MKKLLLLSVFLLPILSVAQDKGFNLKGGVDLQMLTEIVQRRTKKQFMYTQATGLKEVKVFFISDNPLDKPEDLFKVYESILQMNGFALIPVGEKDKEIFKIIRAEPQVAPSRFPPRLVEEIKDPQDQYVTRIFKLKYALPSDLLNQIMNKIVPVQQVIAVDSSGILLVTDYDHNIKRIEEIIKYADVKREDVLMEVVPLKNALSTHVARILDGLAQTIIQVPTPGVVIPRPAVPGRPEREIIKIVEDTRTNSIIIVAERERMKQMLEIVGELDAEVGFETSAIFVYTLKHANAKATSEIINKLYEARPAQTTQATQPGQAAGAGAVEQVKPIIAPDERTNSLIIVSDRNTYKQIEGLLSRLDKRRPQVLLKATVVEVRGEDSLDFGTALAEAVKLKSRATKMAGGASVFNRPGIQDFATFQDVNNDGILDIVPVPPTPGGILLAYLEVNQVGALIKALQSKADISILDEPEVVTEDNAKAEIILQDNIAVTQVTYVGAALNPVESFKEFIRADTILTISPHISETQEVQLSINIKVEKFTRPQVDPRVPPPKSTRELKIDSLKVPNARTVVIGGVITQDSQELTSQVPIIGDVPILGELFKRRISSKTKKTLYIFITPYILYQEKYGDLFNFTKDRADEIEKLREKPLYLELESKKKPEPRSTFRFKAPEH